MSCRIVCNFWGCSHVERPRGILIMWDKRVGEKVAECVGDYTLAISFRNVADHST